MSLRAMGPGARPDQCRQRVFKLEGLLQQRLERGLGSQLAGLGLAHVGPAGLPGPHQRLLRGYVFIPAPYGLPRYPGLPVIHQQHVVVAGYRGHELRLHRLLIGHALFERCRLYALLVGQLPENVDLPAHLRPHAVGLLRLCPVMAAQRAGDCEAGRRQQGFPGGRERGRGLNGLQPRRGQVGIVGQPFGYERLQQCVGEHLTPPHLAHRRRAVGGQLAAQQCAKACVGALISAIYTARRKRGGGHGGSHYINPSHSFTSTLVSSLKVLAGISRSCIA